jgi:hypothetical protein
LRAFLAVVPMVLLVACSGIGDGNRPVSMRLIDSQTGADSLRLFQCFEGAATALVTFADGSLADFLNPQASRPVELRSSDDSVFRVSNGELPVPGREGQFYRRGTLIPVAPGTARLRAQFSDLVAEAEVTVLVPESLSIEPAVQTVAVGAGQQFNATAVLDGVSTGFNASLLWRLLDANGNEVDAEIATLGASSGALAALAEGGPFTVSGMLSACPQPSDLPATVEPEDLQARVLLREAVTLELVREFAREDSEGTPLPPQPLVVNTSEAFDVIARFADPEDGSQTISGFARFQIEEPGLAEGETSEKALFGLSGLRNLLTVLAPTEAALAVSARFGEEDAELVSNSLPVEVVAATLAEISLSPEDAVLPRGARENFVATGRFTRAGEADLLQDIRRHVVWSSSVPAVATITSGAASPGRLTVTAREPGCTRIRAQALASLTAADATPASADTQLFAIDDTVACAAVPETES